MKANFYNVALPSHEVDFNDSAVIDWALGFDFGSEETTEQDLKHLTYIDTINGVEIWFCYGTDTYLFTEITD